MKKSIFTLHIFFMHVLVLLNLKKKKENPIYQYKSVIKKREVDNYYQIKKMLSVLYESIKLFETCAYVKHYEIILKN